MNTRYQAEWITRIVMATDLCPLCGETMSTVPDEQKLTPYGYYQITYRELIENPEAYAGKITLCHLDCWNNLPETERQKLRD